MRIKLMPLVVALSLLCALFAILDPSPAAGQRRSQSRGKNQKQKKPTPRPTPRQEYETVGFTSAQEPELGMKLPGKPPRYGRIIMETGTPAPNDPGMWISKGDIFIVYDIKWAGIKGIIGEKDWVINYISTSDPAFVTPEGIKVGDSAEKVLKISKAEVVKANDYVFYIRLPSGWRAEFRLPVEYDANGKLKAVTNGQLSPDTKVIGFDKK